MDKKLKKAFSIAELIIVFLIASIILVLTLFSFKFHSEKVIKAKAEKAYVTLEQIISQMAKDEAAYSSENFPNRIFQDINSNVSIIKDGEIKPISGPSKFCEVFLSKAETNEESSCESTSFPNTPTFISPDGAEWYLPPFDDPDNSDKNETSGDFANGYQKVIVDVNGKNTPNCFAEEQGCKVPDRFRYYIIVNGTISKEQPTDIKADEYTLTVEAINGSNEDVNTTLATTKTITRVKRNDDGTEKTKEIDEQSESSSNKLSEKTKEGVQYYIYSGLKNTEVKHNYKEGCPEGYECSIEYKYHLTVQPPSGYTSSEGTEIDIKIDNADETIRTKIYPIEKYIARLTIDCPNGGTNCINIEKIEPDIGSGNILSSGNIIHIKNLSTGSYKLTLSTTENHLAFGTQYTDTKMVQPISIGKDKDENKDNIIKIPNTIFVGDCACSKRDSSTYGPIEADGTYNRDMDLCKQFVEVTENNGEITKIEVKSGHPLCIHKD